MCTSEHNGEKMVSRNRQCLSLSKFLHGFNDCSQFIRSRLQIQAHQDGDMPTPPGKRLQFLEPKPIRKRNPKDSWFYVQKKLITSWRPEKLLRCYQTLTKHKWDTCGLAIQLKKQLIRKKGHAWLHAQEKDDDNE